MKILQKQLFKFNVKQHLSVLISSSLILLPVEVQALPSGEHVVAGSAAFKAAQNQLTVTASNRAIINYNSFNIASKERVIFVQPSSNSVVLNRVVLANPSSILGTLNANGRIFLVNPAGIYFGANSVVNANSFLATTLNITDNDFLNDNYNFTQMKNLASSYIIQKGSITVSPEGFVVLAAPFVSSEGAIMAKAGHIVIGATNNFFIQFDSDGLVQYNYKQTQKEDTPIILPKEYANDIIDNVVNTDSLGNAIQIVHKGNKIELVGGSGTALVSATLNADATQAGKVGTIGVKAQQQTFMLNKADLHADALKEGNGGSINIFADKLTYADKGASFSANAGSIQGNGGSLEISAKDTVLFDGSKVSLHAPNGEMGIFLIDPEDIVISSNSIYSGIDTSFIASESITVNDGITVSTRDIGSSADYLHATSQGNSGSLNMSAPSITVGSGSNLLTFADNGYTSGALTLQAISNTADVGVQALSSINLNGSYLRGGAISIKAEANSLDHFDSTDSANPVDPIEQALDFLSDVPTLPVGLSIAKSKATVDVKNGTTIDGDSIDITTNANSQASVLTIFTAVGVGYGKSEATAQTSIRDGATLKSTHDINIQSNVVSDNKVKVYTVGLGAGRGSTANMSLAYAKSDTTSTVNIENGANVNTAGNLNVDATTSKEIEALASAGSYDNGTVGASVAITNSNSDTEANVGGTINAKALSISAQTDNNLIKTASSSAVGSGAISGRVVSATNNVISSVEKYFNAHAQSSNSESGSSKPALSAAFSYADHTSNSVADIADSAVVNVDTTTDISAKNSYPIDTANGKKGVKSSATATIDSNDADQKTYSVAGAVAITKLSNTAKAYIGEGSVLNSKGDIALSSSTKMPYEITWGQVNSVSDIADYANSNLGLQNGFFTTWAQSNSQGTVAGVAGSVNYFHMTNDTESYVDKNAKINQNQTQYGALTLEALTDLETMNLAGVFGWKVLGSSGKSGLGGSYLDIQYDDTTKAEINDGAYAKANTLSMSAIANTKNISVAEAGTSAEKYGAAGSFSYLRIHNTTQTNVNNANIIVTGASVADDLALKSDDTAKLFNVSGGIIKSGNVGIGASVSINEITRDTESNVNDSVFQNTKNMLVSAKNSGEIDAYSLAASVTTALGVELSHDSMAGQYGIGLSGDVSLNRINDTTIASVTNSNNAANQNSAHDIALTSDDSTNIQAYAGSVSFAVSNKLSAGLAGSYSQNDITSTTKATIDKSTLYAHDLSLDAENTSSIQSYTASGSGAISGGVSVAIAGSVSLNNISNEVYAEVINTSDISSSGKVSLNAQDTPTIKTVAGAAALSGAAGVGASLSKNDIKDKAYAYISDSKVSSDSDLDLFSSMNGDIHAIAASLAAATSGMAASVTVVLNKIANSIQSWVQNGDIEAAATNVKATDSESISTTAGQLTAANDAGFGASVLYNTIANTIYAYVDNSNINANGNIQLKASSDKTIDTKAAGGAAGGTLAGAGGVIINSIKDDAKSYIKGSSVTTTDSLSILAYEKNTLEAMAGILSVGKTLGIGGAVLTNIIENQIASYIDASQVKAKGATSVATLLVDGSGNSANMNGLDVLAYSDESVDSKVANISGGGTAAVAASVSVNLIKDSTNSYAKNNNVNENNGDANSLQSVRVRAVSNSDISAMAGGLAAGGEVGIGAASDTSMIKNSTNAYITGGFIYAKNLLQTTSQSYDHLNSTVVSGAFSGSASLAGSLAIANIDNTNNAHMQETTAYSDKNLDISAGDNSYLGIKKDGTHSGIKAGSLSIGGIAGVGGSVVVTKVAQNVQAYAADAHLNAKGDTSILANGVSDFIVYAASANLGAYAGAGGAVTINTADTTTKAYTSASAVGKMLINQDDAYKTIAQDVTISANNANTITSSPGSSGGGLVGVSGSIDVSTIHNTSLAEIGVNSSVNANRNLLIRAVANKNIYSNVAAGAGGAIGVAGAVSVANINTNIDSNGLSASDNTKDTTNTLTTRSAVGSQIGDSTTATDTKTELDGSTTLSVDDDFKEASSPAETTYARIADNSIINAGNQVSVKTSDTAAVHSTTGVVSGGVIGVGGSVSIANIGADTRAYVGKNVHLQSGSTEIKSYLEVKNNKLESYAAAAGAVGLGAAVSKFTLNYENDAYSDAGSELSAYNGDVSINAQSDLSSNAAKAYGAAIGAAAVGLVKAGLSQKGKTQAVIYSSSVNAKNNINIVATDTETGLESLSEASTGGIVNGSGSISSIEADPTLLAFLGDGVSSVSGDDTSIFTSSLASLASEANGVNVGGITVGISKATASWNPTLTTQIGSNTDITADNLNLTAYENMNSSGASQTANSISAKAYSATGALVGGTGSHAEATRDASVKSIIWNDNTVEAKGDININTKAFGKTDASADGYAYGVLAGGFTGSTSTNKATANSIVGTNNILNSNKNINFDTYSRNEALSYSRGGAGGLLAGSGTKATSNIEQNSVYTNIQEGTKLLADNADMSIKSTGHVNASSTSTVVTAGGVTKNESEANTQVHQDIGVDIDKNTQLVAQNIDIEAVGSYLHAKANAHSTTTAGDTTSHAYSNVDVTSSTNVNIKSGADITGYNSIAIKSLQNSNVLFDSYADAKITGGTGTVDAKAHNNPTLTADVTTDVGTSFTTKNLDVETNAIGQSNDTYKINAYAEANTVVNWVLTTVDEKVKEVSKWPIIGWVVKWVWKKVKKWVKKITHSDVSSSTSGDYSSSALLTMNSDIHQKTSLAQNLNIASDGTITSSGGEISAQNSGDDIVVNDLINHDEGVIKLESNGDVKGHSNVYLDNKYPDVTINNESDKNLQIHNINTVSDNADKPNIQVLYGSTNSYSSTFSTESPLHTLHITNSGTGDLYLNGTISNYGGDTTLLNQYGNIFGSSGMLIKTKNLNLNANRGALGSNTMPIEVELQKSAITNPSLTTNSFYDTYLGLKAGEITNTQQDNSYVVDGIDLSNIQADGKVNLTLHTGDTYYKDGDGVVTATPSMSHYYINQFNATGNINIDADTGVFLNLDGTMSSGMADQTVTLNSTMDPYSTDARYVASQTADTINLKNITQPGGSVNITLADGSLAGSGTINMVDGNSHITVNNLSSKNVHFQEVNTNSRSDNGLYINGTKEITPYNGIALGSLGYSEGSIDISSNNGGKVQLGGTMLNQSGYTNIRGNNGLYNTGTYLINSKDMLFDLSQGGDVGTAANPIYTAGKVSAKSISSVHLYAPTQLDIDTIHAQDAHLISNGDIKSTDGIGTNITADSVELQAQGDISSLADNFVTLSADTIAANSINGAIKLNNVKNSVIGTVGNTTGLHGANNVAFTSQGTLHQRKGADIVSDNANVLLTSAGNMDFDYIQAPQRVTLNSQNGAISQDGDSAVDISSNEAFLHASSGIGSNNQLDTAVNVLDAKNDTANDISIANTGSLTVNDLDSNGYTLYNGGGSIRITTDGTFTQASPTTILANGSLDITAQDNIFASYMKSLHNLTLHSYDGDILGDSANNPNLSVKDQLTLYADHGVIGTPANPISIVRENGGVIIEATVAKEFLSTYIFGANAPTNNFLDQGLTAFNNRIINGTLIEQYYSMFYNYGNMVNITLPQSVTPSSKKSEVSSVISIDGGE